MIFDWILEQEQSVLRILNALSDVSLDSFEDRLKLQKIVFLARRMGYNLGYSFDWYVRGPYSPSLTRMLFSAQNDDRLVIEVGTLSGRERVIVDALRAFLEEDIDNPAQLELLASVWYFARKSAYTPEEREQLLNEIIRRKPQYTLTEIEKTIDRILRHTH